MTRSSRVLACLGLALATLCGPGPVGAQDRAALDAELQRIFESTHYRAKTFGPSRWLDGGAAYTTVEPSASVSGAHDLVRYDTASGARSVLVDARRLRPEGRDDALEMADYAWSHDRQRLLVFTNTVRVWRLETKGDYWVLDLAPGGRLRQLGGDGAPSTLMFAKFSPDGTHVAYVRDHDLFVEDLTTSEIRALTTGGGGSIINGTSDWVYEEELGVRDGFRWSPDGRSVAYWSFDTTGIGEFTLINSTDTLYPTTTEIPYPKVGTTNAAVRIGVVSVTGGDTTWMDVPGDPRNTYLARMDWADADTLALQHLNRLQNTIDVLLADRATGRVRRVHRDESTTWVDVGGDLSWLNGGRDFLWLSEKRGWRHAYRVGRDGGERRITNMEADVIDIAGTDASNAWLYYVASPDVASQQYLYRTRLDGTGTPERISPNDEPGTHAYDLAPNGEWALHTYSRFEVPPRIELVHLPDHRVVRTLEDNADLAAKVANLRAHPAEFFTVPVDDGVVLDGWMIKPRPFDAGRTYPLLVYVYGEPAEQTVVDRWGGPRMLYHRALADAGFIVVSVDNRGTPAPKGTAWRKAVYGAVGVLSAREQAAAVRALAARHSFIDADRVAVWGWSGGGSNTLNCLFRYPDVFKAGISVAPVPDQTLYDTIYQERYMGLPSTNPDGYRAGSPVHVAEGLRGRLLLVHGTGDDNVHYQGTERLINRLIELGKSFDVMVYPNRTHAIREGAGTTLHLHRLMARYLTQLSW